MPCTRTTSALAVGDPEEEIDSRAITMELGISSPDLPSSVGSLPRSRRRPSTVEDTDSGRRWLGRRRPVGVVLVSGGLHALSGSSSGEVPALCGRVQDLVSKTCANEPLKRSKRSRSRSPDTSQRNDSGWRITAHLRPPGLEHDSHVRRAFTERCHSGNLSSPCGSGWGNVDTPFLDLV